jgi:hypothetical protein
MKNTHLSGGHVQQMVNEKSHRWTRATLSITNRQQRQAVIGSERCSVIGVPGALNNLCFFTRGVCATATTTSSNRERATAFALPGVRDLCRAGYRQFACR